jgi:hypothetical protein
VRELSQVTALDRMEASIADLPPVELPLGHFFTPGIYARTIKMPKGSVVSSMKHKTCHFFSVLSGEIAVLKESESGHMEVEGHFKAPHLGITTEGTKRLLYAIEDTIWVTFHATNETDPDKIVEEITEPNDNPLIDISLDRFNTWKKEISPSITYNATNQPKELEV